METKREKLKRKLQEFGYAEETIKKLLQVKTRPTLIKAIELDNIYKIPIKSWLDIRIYIRE